MTEYGQPGSDRPAGAEEVAARPVAPVSGGYPYPSPGQPPAAVAGWPPVAPAPREAAWRTERIEAVPGTPFGVAHLALRPVVSGPAIGALIAGIASILVSLLVLCFGLSGSQEDWGGWVAGAFAVLAGLAGLAGVVIGLGAVRQIRRSNHSPTIRFTGRGLAISGVSCGGVGLGITLVSLALALSLQLD
ncbi:MAG TPA: hypothetical protein VF755_10225 [Catenuloplanes sp.]|jgi:hypothetical protein